MIAKLIKKEFSNEYIEYLLYETDTKSELLPLAKTGVGHGYLKLNLKNCQEIEIDNELPNTIPYLGNVYVIMSCGLTNGCLEPESPCSCNIKPSLDKDGCLQLTKIDGLFQSIK